MSVYSGGTTPQYTTEKQAIVTSGTAAAPYVNEADTLYTTEKEPQVTTETAAPGTTDPGAV